VRASFLLLWRAYCFYWLTRSFGSTASGKRPKHGVEGKRITLDADVAAIFDAL
jgi:hypothetical protein